MEIKVPGVKVYRSRGRLYAYHRKTATRLTSPLGTSEFLAEVERLNALLPPEPRDGSFGALVRDYKRSPEFTSLADRTKLDYDKVFDWLIPYDGAPVFEFDTGKILRIRDKAYGTKRRRFANYIVQVIRLLFSWGKPRGWLETNPAVDVPMIRRPRDARKVNRPWKDYELTVVLAAATGGLRVGIGLAAYAGISQGDVIRFPWSGYHDGRIDYSRHKTGVAVSILAHRDLRAILDAEAKRSPIIVTGKRGKPYTGSGFRSLFFALTRKLRRENKIEPGLTFHGLRHTVGKMIIEAGGTTADVQAVLGHKSAKQSVEYAEEFDRKRRGTLTIQRLERKRPANV